MEQGTTIKPRRGNNVVIFFLIFLLGLTNGAWGWFYYSQYNERTQLNAKINNLNEENVRLSNKLKSLGSTDGAGSWREIPELKVRYKLTDETSSLSYLYIPAPGLASSPSEEPIWLHFSTKELMSDTYETINKQTQSKELVQCGLDKIIGISVGVVGPEYNVSPDGSTNAKKAVEQGTMKETVKKLNDTTYIFINDAAGNGLSVEGLDKQPTVGCDKDLQNKAIAAGKTAFASMEVY